MEHGHMFFTALFTKLKDGSNECPCMDEWKYRMWYMLTTECLSAFRKGSS